MAQFHKRKHTIWGFSIYLFIYLISSKHDYAHGAKSTGKWNNRIHSKIHWNSDNNNNKIIKKQSEKITSK